MKHAESAGLGSSALILVITAQCSPTPDTHEGVLEDDGCSFHHSTLQLARTLARMAR